MRFGVIRAAWAMRHLVKRALSRTALKDRGPGEPWRVAKRIVANLARDPRGRRLLWEIGGRPQAACAMDEDDLAATLHLVLRDARTAVRVEIREEGPWVAVSITIDGPEPDEVGAAVAQESGERPIRLPETRPHFGVARRIVEAAGGRFHDHPMGTGAKTVILLLPRALEHRKHSSRPAPLRGLWPLAEPAAQETTRRGDADVVPPTAASARFPRKYGLG